jgi:hypothetical protein
MEAVIMPAFAPVLSRVVDARGGETDAGRV